ncbi:putative proteasome subunit beta type-2 [Nosema granulosis]|uniref:Proteasome subunit beta n=1 Tax=Nosema granulosis TaxID=83296 RepID=A0A9P6H429_9MICR|nr:putative proteasome subunit beta type-2 [Nosema granulosis]
MNLITKTGTTIVGLKYKGGVVLCADTRSTSGPIVADKNCSKIHKITENIYSCGAGTAADTRRVCRMAGKEANLFKSKYNRTPRLTHCIATMVQHLHNYGGHISAALVVGGFDDKGCHLYEVHPHGSSMEVSFTAMGSGSLAAIAMLENGYREMDKEEAIALGASAIEAGILNDLYSGSNIDVCVITTGGVEYLRNYKVVGMRNNIPSLSYPLSSVKILKEDVFKYVEEI